MRALHTPQQETNSAYNPGVAYQGGQFLAQGISQAGGAISEGLQRYAQNREEAAALDTRFESTAKPLMEKLKLYGQLADENSPAAALLDKSADWHKLGTSQKKVLLADMMLLGDKTEAEQRRKEEDQWKQLAAQDRQAQFEEQQRQNVRQGGQWAAAHALQVFNTEQDNARASERLGMDRQNFANLEEARRAKLAAEARMTANLAQFQALAGEPTGPSRMGGAAAAALFSQPGSGLPDFSAYGPRDTQLTPQPLSRERIAELGVQTGAAFHPQFNDLAKLYQGEDPLTRYNAETARMNAVNSRLFAERNAPQTGAQPRTMTTADRVKVEAEITKTLDLYNKAPDAASRGRYLDVLRQLEAMRGGSPTAAPAAGAGGPAPTAGDKVVVEKDGKKFRLPKAQLDQAQREGYKLSQ